MKRTQHTVVCALIFVLTAGIVGAGWGVDNPYTSYPESTTYHFLNKLLATVTTNSDNSYHYVYVLDYQNGRNGSALTKFSIANPDHLAFSNWHCDANLQLDETSTDSVLWKSGSVATGNTVTFSYDSVYSYGEVNVTIYGGANSYGKTLGMVNNPEPSSLLAVAFGFGGILWTRLKRRK